MFRRNFERDFGGRRVAWKIHYGVVCRGPILGTYSDREFWDFLLLTNIFHIMVCVLCVRVCVRVRVCCVCVT